MTPRDDAATDAEPYAARREEGDARSHARPLPAPPTAGATLAGRAPAARFLGRLAQLSIAELGRAVEHWHRLADDAWFAAEDAVTDAVTSARRHAEQEVLLEQVARLFRLSAWFNGEAGARADATETSAQYVATIAMIALLVRDHVSPAEFELLYRPFSELVPLEELGRE